MKQLFLLTILFLSFSGSMFSQDKSSSIKELFKIMECEKMIDEMMNNMIPILKEQANGVIKGEDAKEKFDNYIDFMMTEMQELTHVMVNEEMISIYTNHFNQKEIEDLIVFYKTPTGKKILEKTPVITKELMQVMMQKHMPSLQAKLIKKLEELR